ncbi:MULTISPECIES: hypothetical protein [unclassified Flavobacterium]|uniref:hypothetical protein n=1 Tax=unclassified Flavobacterium TaxID=196869 RepID=UPI000F0CFE24|nr:MULTISPECIES: hypothetical protein [unclassified Flavobacterium]AYN03381.1 hypothetical protein EAG11_03730 [Flavobacterium sp. 140616W15]MCD0476059.1 hypothetical protein [Flavobacterium sp. EDS]
MVLIIKEKINDVEVDMEYIHNLDKNGMVPGIQDVLIAKLNKEAPQFRDYIKVFILPLID